MVEAAEADVVGPAVAADDPDALSTSASASTRAAARCGVVDCRRAASSARRRARAARRCRPRRLSASRIAPRSSADGDVELAEQRAAPAPPAGRARGACRARTRRCPRRASSPRPVRVHRRSRPGRRRQVAAVDRRAAGRVRDEHAVAEELGQQLEVGRLAAARAGAGELEQRLEQLRALDRSRLDQRPVELREREEEVPAARAPRRGARPSAADVERLVLRHAPCFVAGQVVDAEPQPVQSSGDDLDRQSACRAGPCRATPSS